MQSRFAAFSMVKIALSFYVSVFFMFGFIALDFPTEFSALFDSCGVIINLNNEIPKWNPIYNSSHLGQKIEWQSGRELLREKEKAGSEERMDIQFAFVQFHLCRKMYEMFLTNFMLYQKLSLAEIWTKLFSSVKSFVHTQNPLWRRARASSLTHARPFDNRKLIWILWFGS